jgi:lipid-A-disaccharide synthase
MKGDLLVVAGEASGDLHGGRLLEALAGRAPELRSFGLGGERMVAAGLAPVADVSAISVVGIAEAVAILSRAREIFRQTLAAAEARRPLAAVLIDFPEFNLRLARQLAWLGIPVVYYVSPQIWAWRRGRVRTLADCVERMLVLFPFEVPFYRRHGVPVVHVGHPLVDEVPRLPQAWQGEPRHGSRTPRRIALLPGSRRSEIAALLPTLLESARRIALDTPSEFRLLRAPSISEADLAPFLREVDLPIQVVETERLEAIADSHLAICASGTATLEVGLLGTPMIVVYRLNPWSFRLGRLLVRVPHFSLVNLVLERGVVPELLQHDARPERIAAEALPLLASAKASLPQREALRELRALLGPPGASERAADQVLAAIAGRSAAA